MNWLVMSSLKISPLLLFCLWVNFALGQSPIAGEQARVDKSSGTYTLLSGTIHQSAAAEVGLKFHRDFISFDEELFHIPIGSDHQFSMSFELTEPTTAELSYNGEIIHLYLEPGDQLQLDFDGATFPQSIRYSGKGSEHNTCLKAFHQQFIQWDEANLVYEMADRTAMDFRRFMDGLWRQKWAFHETYLQRNKVNFSAQFNYYLSAEIDYWWAYYLVRYRIEKPIASNAPVPMDLPFDYYSFLDKVVVSNDFALNNRYYLYFLEQYLSLRNDLKGTAADSSFQTTGILVEAPSMFMLAAPETPPMLTELKHGTRLKYLGEQSDFKSKVLIKEALHEDYWFKVRTPDGIEGWVVGVGLEFEKEGELNEVQSSNDTLDRQGRHLNARNYLHGNALYYTIAHDIYWRSHVEKTNVLEKEIADFLINNTIRSYDQIIEAKLETEVKGRMAEKKDVIYGSTNFRIVKKPTIISKHPEEEAILVSNSSDEPILDESTVVEIDGNEAVSVPIPIIASTVIGSADTLALIDSTAVEVEMDSLAIETLVVTKPVPPTTPPTFVDIAPPPLNRPGTHTMVQGRLESAPTRLLKLVLYSDPIQFEEIEHKISFNANHQFELNLELPEPTIGYLYYGNEKVDLYIEPGDNFTFSFDPQNFHKTLFFRGRGAENNNYLKNREMVFAELDADLSKQIKNQNVLAFMSYLKENLKEKRGYLRDYNHAHAFTKSFLAYAEADIDYWFGFNLLNYPWENPLHYNQEGPLQLDGTYYGALDEISVVSEDALPNQNYTYFLEQFFSYQKTQLENEGLDNFQLAEKYLQGTPLNYYKTKLFAIDCRRGKAREAGPYIKEFIQESNNDGFNDVLRLIYNDAKGLLKGEAAPDFSLADINGQMVNLSDLRGKIVYLDFWATWCPPCVHALRNSKQWKSKFKGKDVAFVYVSLDKDQNSWRNFIRRQGIDGIHVIVDSPNVYQSKIAKRYKVKRLPAVFLLDKAGKIHYNSSDKDARKVPVADMINDLLLSN